MLASVFNGFEMNLSFHAFAKQLLTMNLREKGAFILTALLGGTDRKWEGKTKVRIEPAGVSTLLESFINPPWIG